MVELGVDRAVERIGEVDPLAVAADLDDLRPAVERLAGFAGCAARAAMPPIRTFPFSTGANGSDTSYCSMSPVPQQET